MTKQLWIIRGVSGSGKSSLAELVAYAAVASGVSDEQIEWNEADHFFEQADGSYKFDANLLDAAHMRCINNTKSAMQAGKRVVIVSNTFTTNKEVEPYRALAETFGYQVQEVICKGQFNDVHNVPPYVKERQRARFQYV